MKKISAWLILWTMCCAGAGCSSAIRGTISPVVLDRTTASVENGLDIYLLNNGRRL